MTGRADFLTVLLPAGLAFGNVDRAGRARPGSAGRGGVLASNKRQEVFVSSCRVLAAPWSSASAFNVNFNNGNVNNDDIGNNNGVRCVRAGT